MALTLTPEFHGEQLVAQHLRSGRFQSPEEVVTRALESLSHQRGLPEPQQNRTVEEAVARIRASRKGVTPGGIKIKDLIHAGHKY
jgi:hypothetical protein